MRASLSMKLGAVLASAAAILGSQIASSQQPGATEAGRPAGGGPTSAPAAAAAPAGRGFPPMPGAQIYTDNCAGCHGTDLAGGRGPSLFSEAILSKLSDEQIHHTLQTGIPPEMPSFKDVLQDAQMWQVIAYLRTKGAELKGKPTFVANPDGQVIRTAKQAFRIEAVAKGLDTPWGLAFRPDGSLLVTERSGNLRIIDRSGHLLPDPVKNTPKPWVRQDGGMLDVALHPDYAKNGLIYLSYSELQPGHVLTKEETDPPAGTRPVNPPSMTVLVRGRINAKNEWVQDRVIFRAPASLYTPSGAHYGTRFLFDGKGHLFYSLGERGDMTNAQRLDSPLGKIHRVNDDGSVPADNPFVHTPGAIPTIWTYGHRNPEGLAFDPRTGLLWESEHGPMGGDEINIIEKGKNYGWGVISMGIQPGITKREAPGMEQPIVYYTPTIAPSGIGFYSGNRYPGWKGNLFVAGLAGQQLRRLEISGRQVTAQEVVFAQFGRTRAVTTGPDGLLYVLLQNPTGAGTGISLSAGTPGMVIRLVPVK